MESPVAPKYAKALFEKGLELNQLSQIYSDVEALSKICAESEEFARFLKNPTLSHQTQKSILKDLFADKIHATLYQLLTVLAAKERLSFLKDVLKCFEDMYLEHDGTIRVKFISPFELSPSKLQSLVEAFAQSVAKKIEPSSEIDPRLIGGIKIQMKDQVYDFSVKHQLERFEKQLLHT